MAKVGRKSLYSEQIVDEITKIIAIGASDKTAYEYVGISERTFYRWMEEKKQFGQAISRARAKGKLGLHQRVVTASSEDWRAGAWLLSHRWPEESKLRHRGGVEVRIKYADGRSKDK